MRTTLLVLAAGSMALSGCTSEPVEIPEDLTEAAKTCFVVQAMNLRDANNRTEDDPISLTEYSKAVQYAMIAASRSDNFSIETVLSALPNVDTMVEELKGKDYEAALPVCQKKFGVSDSAPAPTLPEKDIDAGMSCYAMSQFFSGGIQGEEIDSEGKGAFYTELNTRLEAQLDRLITSDAEALAAFTTEEAAQKMITDGLKEAFSNGDPQAYLAACDTRFPAEAPAAAPAE